MGDIVLTRPKTLYMNRVYKFEWFRVRGKYLNTSVVWDKGNYFIRKKLTPNFGQKWV